MNADELRARRGFVGASDVPAILGLDRYRSSHDVWLEKTGRVELVPTPSDPAEFGSAVEPVLVAWAAQKLGVTVQRGQVAHHPTLPFCRAQLDGWVQSQQAVVEAKAYGLWNPMWDGSEWGNDGSDNVPFNVLAQVNFQMACSSATAGYVSALLGRGMGVRVYYLPREEALVQRIQDAVVAFWEGNVLADVPPTTPVSLDTLKLVVREPDKVVEVDAGWPDRWASLKDQEALVGAAVQEARRSILQEMGDAEVGYTPFGHFSYRANARGVRTFRFHGGPDAA